MRIACVIGHNSVNKGATSLYLGEPEYTYNKSIADSLRDVCDVYERYYNSGGYDDEIKDLADRVNRVNYGLVFELHYNAAVPSAHGCEALYHYKTSKGDVYAELFCEILTRNYGLYNRGAKSTKEGGRGFLFLDMIKAPAIILEPFFGSNIEAKEFKDKLFYETVLREFIKSVEYL